MTHHLITTEALGNQLDKVLFRVDPTHSSFPEFQKWASDHSCRLSAGKDMMTLPKEKALEIIGTFNQKGWTDDTSEEVSQMLVTESNSRVMSIASREAAAAKHSSAQPAVAAPKNKKVAATETVH